ncbi:histidine phosphatase family protein [Skermanella pratensis]|uniref:histidine phosphatase family protein n=1 Tax=Skermanella pratensis TaxID=2233999 RepID=UPI001300F55B|nr:histidine phosphatase family protein [Skermanella pratensis]
MHLLNIFRRGQRLGLCLILLVAAMPARADEQAAWAALGQGGHIALMRHAVTVPGVGDPPGFRLGDCATQRLLSDAGRDWARRIGADLRKRGAAAGRVLTSAWCRCVETAELMDLGPVEVFEPLNSFFGTGEGGVKQTEAARELMAAWRGPATLVLVTHQVNVTALTGIYPTSGEIVVLRPGGEVVGRIRP